MALAICAPAIAAIPSVEGMAHATVTPAKYGKEYEAESVNYHFLQYSGNSGGDILLEVKATSRDKSGAELVRGTVKARALYKAVELPQSLPWKK
ncbi:MAG: hypothetical protein WCO71_02710 [Pseudomonadota bacterium]